MSTLELELKKIGDLKQDVERKLRVGEDDKASFEKVGAACVNCVGYSETGSKCRSLHLSSAEL